MKNYLLLLIALFICASTVSAEIYQCSGFVFSDFPCRTTPLRTLTPDLHIHSEETRIALEETFKSISNVTAISQSDLRRENSKFCAQIAWRLTELTTRRRHGYRANEEASLDRQKTKLKQQQRSHCSRSKVRVIQGDRVSQQ